MLITRIYMQVSHYTYKNETPPPLVLPPVLSAWLLPTSRIAMTIVGHAQTEAKPQSNRHAYYFVIELRVCQQPATRVWNICSKEDARDQASTRLESTTGRSAKILGPSRMHVSAALGQLWGYHAEMILTLGCTQNEGQVGI